MSNTVINAKIIDQKVQLTNIPLIASGSQGVLQIKCAFDDLWTGYQTTAVFFREEKDKGTDVFHVPVYLGLADVPHEVLKEEGVFLLGFMGVAENTRTTELIRLEVKRGAITEGVAVPDPTPDVYTQLLQIIQQSSIIPDESLTQAGKAADAKATGDAIQQVRQDVGQMVEETTNYIMGSMADQVIECGTDGDWTWEKWESGKAVCWAVSDFGDIPCNKAWDELHQSGDLTKDFPSGLFVTVPYWNASYVNGDGSAWVAQQYSKGKPATASSTGAFNLVRANNFTLTGVRLGFYAIGRWK